MGRLFEIPQEHIENVMKYYKCSAIQRSVCEEECSELIQVLAKYERCILLVDKEFAENSFRDSIIEELTHVAISLGMLTKIFDISYDEIEAEVRKKAEDARFDVSNYSWHNKHGGIYEIPKYVTDKRGNVIVSPEWLREFQNFARSQSPLYGNAYIDETESVSDDHETKS